MADPKKAGMISGMNPLAVLTGDELLEVSARQRDGSWKTFSIMVNKIRTNAGASAYEVAVLNGFTGTEEEWLESLKGQSAYQLAVSEGFQGDEAEFLKSLVGPSAYEAALEGGFVGDEAAWLESLKGKSAYQIWVLEPGNTGKTEQDFLNSLKGKSAYEIALAANPAIGDEATWLKSLEGDTAYQVALSQGFVGNEQAWLDSLVGRSAYQSWLSQPGNEGKTEAEFVASLKGEKGQDGTNGTNGTNGKSAYEIWKEQAGNSGKTEAEFLESLKGVDGESAYETWLALPGNAGKSEAEFIVAISGEDGKSAYEVWESQPANTGKSEAEYLQSLKGQDGTNGTNGLSAYEVWQTVPGNESKTEQEFLESLEGQSTYELWLAEGNVGDETAFLLSLKGAKGTDGQSAYQLWESQPGNAGKTEAEFLNSLKGAKGADGKNGTDGTGVNVLETLTPEDFAQVVAEGMSAKGDAYLVETFMYIYNGTSWVKSNSIQGPEGKGLNYLGLWPDGVPLPTGNTYVAGDTFVWNHSLWTLVEQPSRQWVDIGVPGPEGKSAYETYKEIPGNENKTKEEFIASLKGQDGTNGTNGESAYETYKKQPGNSDKTEAEFIASLKGDKGDTGDTGKSAYEVWLETNPGKTEAEYLESLEGKSAYEVWEAQPGNTGKTEAEYLAAIKGAKGDPAVAFEIVAKLTNVSELPRPGVATEAYYVGKDLYVWIEAEADYENMGSLDGQSAYEIAVDKGFVGDEDAWLLSLHGGNLVIKGTKPTSGDITSLPTPQEQDAYLAADTDHLWMYIGGIWTDLGKFGGESAYELWKRQAGNESKTEQEFLDSLKGTNGTNGTNGQSAYELWEEQAGNVGKTEAEFLASLEGQSAYQLWVSQPGNTGKTEAEFLESLKGTDGTNGTNGTNGKPVVYKGQVSTRTDLDTGTYAENEAYVTQDTRHLYVRQADDSWTDMGIFSGKDGTNGTDGKSVFEEWVALPENSGKTFDDFLTTLKGADGQGINPKGNVATVADLDTIVNPVKNDAYTVDADGHLYVFDGATWDDLGYMRGAQGIQGATGQGINIVESVELLSERPAASTLSPGDAVFVNENKMLYQVNELGVFGPGINIEGPQGERGEQGPQGETGASIQIMGSYPNLGELQTEHPTGNPGEGYLIGPNLYVYGINPVGGGTEWYDVGEVKGPKGDQGIQGLRGFKGEIGPVGPRGSVWIMLPKGQQTPTGSNGTAGDWAVNEAFITFYNDSVSGWTEVGPLVPGGINSPSAALGKVIRFGSDWIPLPVDAVPNPTEGKIYVMEGTADSKTNWTELVIPESVPPVTSPVQGKQYVMLGGAGGTADWAEVTIPAAGIPEVPANTTIPQGRTSSGWTAVMAAPTGLDATKRYEWLNGAWVTSVIQVAPTTNDTLLCLKVTAAGVQTWEPVSFDAYSLKIDTSAQSANFTPNFKNQQTFRVNGSAARTITLNSFDVGRSVLAVFVVEGTSKVSFVAGTGDPSINYNNNVLAADIEYGATQTIITAFWNGFSGWTISKGPSY
jgi:hypothetical protein